jgi:CPA2 family monovalent cation:H+ antiporter-2
LTQIGELSFVVVQVARSSGLVGENVFTAAIAASLISILLNVFIVRATFGWVDRKHHTPSVSSKQETQA